ncbi:Integral membrane protein CcmA involved in cell shape determination [Snodgrassella alvi SCGC AB-598-O11]|nr:Integral membrane protein CcmA involved in cell shape determination [Snodgrassella alvi SCGC AB-598-O11]
MENELIITRDIVEKYYIKFVVDTFNDIFPHGAKISEITKLIPELEDDYSSFAEWLLQQVPPTDITLEFDTLQDNIFYNGPIHVKGDVNLVNTGIDLIGSLKIDGKLTIIGTGVVYLDKGNVNADEIDISEYAQIYSDTKANSISMSDYAVINGDTVAGNINISGFASIYGNTKTKVINLNGGRIYGNVDTDELYNDGGYISQNAKADKATLINGGNIGGNIAFKCLYTDSNFYAQIFRAS